MGNTDLAEAPHPHQVAVAHRGDDSRIGESLVSGLLRVRPEAVDDAVWGMPPRCAIVLAPDVPIGEIRQLPSPIRAHAQACADVSKGQAVGDVKAKCLPCAVAYIVGSVRCDGSVTVTQVAHAAPLHPLSVPHFQQT